MGLDNGIILETDDKSILDELFGLDEYEKNRFLKTGEVHIAYWRKCWGIRNEIISILHMKQDECEHPVEEDDIPAIIRGLYKFLKHDYWEENGDSIWTYDEIIDNLFSQILNLKWLQKYLKTHPDVKCYFYDSY